MSAYPHPPLLCRVTPYPNKIQEYLTDASFDDIYTSCIVYSI